MAFRWMGIVRICKKLRDLFRSCIVIHRQVRENCLRLSIFTRDLKPSHPASQDPEKDSHQYHHPPSSAVVPLPDAVLQYSAYRSVSTPNSPPSNVHRR